MTEASATLSPQSDGYLTLQTHPDWSWLIDPIDSLATVVDNPVLKLTVTVLAVGLMVGIGYLTTRLQTRLRDSFGDGIADLLTIAIVGVTFLTSAIIVIGVWAMAQDLSAALRDSNLIDRGDVPKLIITLIIGLTAHLVSRVVKRLVEQFLKTSEAVTEHQRRLTYRVSQVVIWIMALLVVLSVWEIELTGLLVGAGFAGIVVGMAARQTLGAVLAGFVLMFARPFEIGDWVEVGDSEGIVTDISIVNTRIQTFDGEYVMIPNDLVSSERVVNRSRKGRLRLEVEVGIDYDADVDHAVSVADDALDEVDEILTVPTPQVVVKELGSSSVVLATRFWIDKPSARRMWRANTAVVKEVKQAFDAEGIKIPYPQRELSGRAETGGFRIADEGVAAEKTSPAASADGGEDASGGGANDGGSE
ncbi:mechanosensitive ion channel family protein [Haloarchaeobius sp. TZWWS8]|uniref:mechanosensitive ion channel family protein n=1 Tax=Haloarchaeobius sp. TZWWS8 TaxID=3446121 RepID=UPI003EBF2DA6